MREDYAQTSAKLRNEACTLLSDALQRIQKADLSNAAEWKTSVDATEMDMVNASSLLNLVNDPERISGYMTLLSNIERKETSA
jgi:hypothetical protein